MQSTTWGQKVYYGAMFATLSYQCSSTFRQTDYLGGCNGARIRFSPQSNWPSNAGLDTVLKRLSPIQGQFPNLSWADLIVLAGTYALETETGRSIKFCGGRTDATDGSGSAMLQPNTDYTLTAAQQKLVANQMGLTNREWVVLAGRPRSATLNEKIGYYGRWTSDPTTFDNEYFVRLLDATWVPNVSPAGKKQYKAVGAENYMLPSDLEIKWDDEFFCNCPRLCSRLQSLYN